MMMMYNGQPIDISTGQMMGGHSTKTLVGKSFDDYVEHVIGPFPYSPHNPSGGDIDNLWKDRRFRLQWSSKALEKDGSAVWRYARVSHFCRWNMGPFDIDVKWSLHFQLEGLPEANNEGQDKDETVLFKGDRVQIQGLMNVPQYNGRSGFLLGGKNKEGRFPVELDPPEDEHYQKKPVHIALKPKNLKYLANQEISLPINRINIDGGGTLQNDHGDSKNDGLISFEWLEPANPQIDLNSKPSVNCPTCRATISLPEKTSLEEKDDNNTTTKEEKKDNADTKEAECPVCLETGPCQNLEPCNHAVCKDCWTKWCHARTASDEFVPPSEEDVDTEQILRERARRDEELVQVLPHTVYKGVATKEGDSEQVIDRCEEKACEWMGKLAHNLMEVAIPDMDEDMDEDEAATPERLKDFYNELVVAPIYVWFVWGREEFLMHLPLPFFKVFIVAVKQRFDEIYAISVQQQEGYPKNELFASVMNRFYCVLGEKYEERDDPLAAIPHYETALEFARQHRSQEQICHMINNVAVAQRTAGRLTEALVNYDKAIKAIPSRADRETQQNTRFNREKLLKEMKEWTGTSGQLTPGC